MNEMTEQEFINLLPAIVENGGSLDPSEIEFIKAFDYGFEPLMGTSITFVVAEIIKNSKRKLYTVGIGADRYEGEVFIQDECYYILKEDQSLTEDMSDQLFSKYVRDIKKTHQQEMDRDFEEEFVV